MNLATYDSTTAKPMIIRVVEDQFHRSSPANSTIRRTSEHAFRITSPLERFLIRACRKKNIQNRPVMPNTKAIIVQGYEKSASKTFGIRVPQAKNQRHRRTAQMSDAPTMM